MEPEPATSPLARSPQPPPAPGPALGTRERSEGRAPIGGVLPTRPGPLHLTQGGSSQFPEETTRRPFCPKAHTFIPSRLSALPFRVEPSRQREEKAGLGIGRCNLKHRASTQSRGSLWKEACVSSRLSLCIARVCEPQCSTSEEVASAAHIPSAPGC